MVVSSQIDAGEQEVVIPLCASSFVYLFFFYTEIIQMTFLTWLYGLTDRFTWAREFLFTYISPFISDQSD